MQHFLNRLRNYLVDSMEREITYCPMNAIHNFSSVFSLSLFNTQRGVGSSLQMCSVEGDRLYPFAHQAVHRLGKKQIADEGNGEKGLHSASKERGHGITRTETGAAQAFTRSDTRCCCHAMSRAAVTEAPIPSVYAYSADWSDRRTMPLRWAGRREGEKWPSDGPAPALATECLSTIHITKRRRRGRIRSV